MSQEAVESGAGGTGEMTEAVLTETQNWAALSHRQLYEAVHRDNDPGRVGEMAEEWNRLSREIGDSSQQMSDRLRGTESGWKGDAADAARAAIQKLAGWNSDAGATASTISSHLGNQGRIMEVAKAEMPEPVDPPPPTHQTLTANDLASMTKATDDVKIAYTKANSDHELAVEVMTNMEAQSRQLDNTTPRFVPPPDPINEEPSEKAVAGNRLSTTTTSTTGAPGDTPGGGPGGGAPGAQEGAPAPGAPGGGAPGPGAPGDVPGPGGAPGPGAPGSAPGSGSQGGAPVPEGSGGVADVEPVAAQAGGGSGSQSGGSGDRVFHDLASGPPGGGDDTDLPDVEPSTTTAQSVTSPSSTTHGSTSLPSTTGGGGDSVRSVGPEGTVIGGSTSKRSHSRGSRSGWSGRVPPIPDTGGGTGIGGAGGSSGGAGGGTGGSLARGGSAGVGPTPGAGAGAGSSAGAGTGARGSSGSAGMGGMGSPGMQRGQGEGDKTRTTKYVEGEPIMETPGADLPPPVIGAGKPKKKPNQEPKQDQEPKPDEG